MKGSLIGALLIIWGAAASARSPAPLYDPVSLNIGLNCQWQRQCIADQTKAMKHALKYVKNERPPTWQIQTCNKNASRKSSRVDWIGFNNCIRNASVRPLPPRPIRKRARGYTERSEARSISRGERGH